MRKFFPLLFIPVLLFSACGQEKQNDDRPATINGGKVVTSITKEDFDAWVKSATIDVAQQCRLRVKNRKEFNQCVQQGRQSIREQVLNGLIGDAWVLNQAAALNIKLSPRERKIIADDVKEKIKTDPKRLAAKYIRQRNTADLLLNTLVKGSGGSPGDYKINRKRAYQAYLKNRKQFDQEERRDFVLITAPSELVAKTMVRMLRRGDSVKEVFKNLAIPGNGPEQAVVYKKSEGEIPAGARFVFDLPKGKLVGPKELDGRYLIARVDNIYPARRSSFKTAYPQIVKLATQEYVRNQIMADLENKWRPKTTCGKGYNSPLCSNRPKQQISG